MNKNQTEKSSQEKRRNTVNENSSKAGFQIKVNKVNNMLIRQSEKMYVQSEKMYVLVRIVLFRMDEYRWIFRYFVFDIKNSI